MNRLMNPRPIKRPEMLLISFEKYKLLTNLEVIWEVFFLLNYTSVFLRGLFFTVHMQACYKNTTFAYDSYVTKVSRELFQFLSAYS
jgi:hypothetical protein